MCACVARFFIFFVWALFFVFVTQVFYSDYFRGNEIVADRVLLVLVLLLFAVAVTFVCERCVFVVVLWPTLLRRGGLDEIEADRVLLVLLLMRLLCHAFGRCFLLLVKGFSSD